jgi:hypothetical protein
VLHHVVSEHLETFLAEARLRGGGEGLPRFVERELREFLTCGSMNRGFARFRCDGCGREILVAFSCKGRGFCPSCCGRRMGEMAAHLVENVLAQSTSLFTKVRRFPTRWPSQASCAKAGRW